MAKIFGWASAAFEQGAGAESIVLSDYVYSAVDSGTSITIAQLENQLAGLDKSATVKIMGFNGSVSRSKGKGRMLGVASNRDGTRVVLRVPDAHHVPGAPSDLLSVSALVAHGYEFHFTASGAWMITPEMDIKDLEQKGGLYWLKWAKAVNPLSAEYVSQAAKQGASQGVCCALLEPTAQERAEVDPWDAVFCCWC
jgi:hypothetical protein